jgi:hypothetical protein
MAGGIRYLATFGASGWVRKLHLQPLGVTGELPWPEHPYSLKRNFPFHWLFSDLLLSGSDLKGREFKEEGRPELRGKKPRFTEVLALPP